MCKKISYYLVFFIIFANMLSANSIFNSFDLGSIDPNKYNPEENNKFSISYSFFKPSRVYNVANSDPNAQISKNKFSSAIGISVNSMTLEASPMYNSGFNPKNGFRVVGYYTFLMNSPINPYIGISYIGRTGLSDSPTKRNIDSYDALLGLELSYLKYINPYFEYMPRSSLFLFGIRFKLHVVVDKKDSIKNKSK